MSDKSRKCEFIQTAPREDRTFLLKSKKELTQLPEQSTDIEADNIIQRYSGRPKVLETYCLADYVSKVVSVSKNKISDNSEQVSRQVVQTTKGTLMKKAHQITITIKIEVVTQSFKMDSQ